MALRAFLILAVVALLQGACAAALPQGALVAGAGVDGAESAATGLRQLLAPEKPNKAKSPKEKDVEHLFKRLEKFAQKPKPKDGARRLLAVAQAADDLAATLLAGRRQLLDVQKPEKPNDAK